MRYIIFIIAVFIATSCSTSNESIAFKHLKPDLLINVFSDSSFFSDIECLSSYKDQILAADFKRDQIFILDTNMKLINTIGNDGDSVNNLYLIRHFAISNDSILVKDGGNNRFQLFSMAGKCLGSIPISENFPRYSQRFLFQNGLMTSYANDSHALVTININDVKQTIFFGERYEFNDHQQNEIRNQRAVFSYEGCKFCVSDNLPFIEKYDNNNNLLEKYDYSNISIIREELQYRLKNKIKSNAYDVLAYDTYLNENKIYILCALKQRNVFTVNTVIEFDVFPNVNPSRIFILPQNSIYKSICVYKDKIYAFSHLDNTLQRFEI